MRIALRLRITLRPRIALRMRIAPVKRLRPRRFALPATRIFPLDPLDPLGLRLRQRRPWPRCVAPQRRALAIAGGVRGAGFAELQRGHAMRCDAVM
ncbi:MAG: hypothetical protein ABI809_11350 [Caldimonas sp.]